MKKNSYILLLLLCMSLLSRKQVLAQDQTPFADENVDDLEDVSDDFQETFFEALKQKGIENHDRAISALNKCIRLEPNKGFLYFERAKNRSALKQHDEAQEDLLKSLELDPNKEAVLALLYDSYYTSQKYEKATETVKKLIGFDSQYKEDLARILTRKKEYKAALALLDELDTEKGQDVYREQMRAAIYRQSGNANLQTKAVEAKIASDPKNEAEYLKLIFLYSEQGNTAKAHETALKLQQINPQADEVHLALYKFYLEDKKTAEAILSMTKVLESTRIDGKAKHRVINDFLIFVNANPEYQPQLEEAIAIFDTQVADAKVYQELANYYISKSQKEKALPYLEKALEGDPENLELIKNTTLLQLDAEQYDKALRVSTAALELYPSQPLLYLTKGVALNKLNKFSEAIESLDIGVDYVIEDIQMEADFYLQLGIAYEGQGDSTTANRYRTKAKSLKAQID